MNAVDPEPEVVKVQDAKTRLSALLRRVEGGDKVTIARGDTPIARLVPIHPDKAARPMGFVAYTLPASFEDPLPGDELQGWDT